MAAGFALSRSVADRLAAHGIKVQHRGPKGWYVPMKQELAGPDPAAYSS